MKKLSLLIGIIILSVGITATFSLAVPVPIMFFDISPTQGSGDQAQDTFYSLQVGDSFWVDMYVTDLPSVSTMGFDLKYNSSQVSISSPMQVNGTHWPYSPLIDDSVSETITVGAGAALGTGVTGTDILLASIGFDCILAGVSNLELSPTSKTGFGFYGFPSGGLLNPEPQEATATIHQTPLPPAILIFGSGLIGIFSVRRKIRK